jgi:hypothetical protein
LCPIRKLENIEKKSGKENLRKIIEEIFAKIKSFEKEKKILNVHF